jgi:hypothetical protein
MNHISYQLNFSAYFLAAEKLSVDELFCYRLYYYPTLLWGSNKIGS